MTAPAHLEEQLRRALAGIRADVVAVYLFGSRARGTAQDDSDVDIGVLFRGEPAATLDGMGKRARVQEFQGFRWVGTSGSGRKRHGAANSGHM